MSSFLDRVRSGANRAAFEADKQRRILAAQAQLRSLRQEADRFYSDIGRATFIRHQSGGLAEPDLAQVCHRMEGLLGQVRSKEAEIESMRAEECAETTADLAVYGRICPRGHGAILDNQVSCTVCGSQAIYLPPPPATAPRCPHCQAPLEPQARFCAECGRPTSASMTPAPPESVAGRCSQCQTALLPDAAFCAECGVLVIKTQRQPAAEPPAVAVAGDRADLVPAEACPVCRTPVLPDAFFCGECGQRMH